MPPGEPTLNAFLKKTLYHWLMLVYRSLQLEFVLLLKFVEFLFGVQQQNRFDLLERM